MMDWLKKHDITAKFLALLVAILVWFFVIAQINPDMESRVKGLDVVITEVDQLTANGLAIVDGGNETIDIKVSGKRDKLILLEADKFQVTASAAQITLPGVYKLNCKVVVDVDGVSVISKNPAQITVVVDRVSSKTVPATINFVGEMSKNYFLENSTLTPDAVVVKGPQSQLEKIMSAEVTYNVEFLSRSLVTTLSYKLVDSEGEEVDMTEISVDTPSITLSATVKSVKKVPLRLDLIYDGVFSDSITQYTANPEHVYIVGDYDDVNKINQINLGTINVMNHVINGYPTLSFDLVVPNGVYLKDKIDKIEVSISTPGYSVEEVEVSAQDIQPTEGYKYITNETVKFKVFGPTDVVKRLTAASMKVYPASVEKIGSDIKVYLSAGVNNPEILVIGDYYILADAKTGSK